MILVSSFYPIYNQSDLLRKYPWLADMFIPEINQLDEISQDPDGKCAMIWILGEFGQVLALMSVFNAIKS